MKLFALFMVISVSTLTPLLAYEIPENPDRFPSVGVNYAGSFLSGKGTFDPVPGFIFSDETGLKDHTNVGDIDIRFPVNENLTVNVGGGYMDRAVTRIDASLDGSLIIGTTLRDSLSGPTMHLGARYYFK